jgi:NitT/TauT family transport system permease protein
MTLAAPARVNKSAVAPDRRKAARSFTTGFDMRLRGLFLTLAGVALLFIVWWLAASLLAQNPQTAAFAGFAPRPALERLLQIMGSGEAWKMTEPSLARVGGGLLFAALCGIPLGILIGRSRILAQITNVPFQFLRMISPLSWMPIAVLTFPTWDGAIVFLIGIAAIWPILFATASGARRIDPAWFKVARNLGAGPYHVLTVVIVPAIAQDILTGIRLALGVAWIVLVPAEYLGVKSGLGYAINDARDTLEYDRLAAIVLMIGVIGFGLDFALQKVIERISWLRQD